MNKFFKISAIAVAFLLMINIGCVFAQPEDINYNKVEPLQNIHRSFEVGLKESEQHFNTIIVEASYSKNISPDFAVLKFGFETTSDSLEDANLSSKNQEGVLIENLKNFDAKLSTEYFSIYPKYDYTEDGSVFVGHCISNYYSLKVNNINVIEDVKSALISSGITNFNSVEFGVEDKATAYNDALSEALINAEQKAKVLAGEKQIELVSVIEKNVNYYSGVSPIMYRAETGTVTGNVVIAANLKVVYKIVENNI